MKERLKVGFNASLLGTSTMRGWNRYTVNLLSALGKLEIDMVLYAMDPVHESVLSRLPSQVQIRQSSKMKYPIWEGAWLPFQCSKDKIDVFHSPFHYGVPWLGSHKNVVTLHDALQPENDWKSSFYFKMARRSAHHIITVSEFSKRSLMEKLGIPESKISVTYEAADERFLQPVSDVEKKKVLNKFQIAKPFVFYVGGFEDRKNLEFLLGAYALAQLKDVDLVLAGGNEEQISSFKQKAEKLNVKEQVHLLGPLSDSEIAAFYSLAHCFVYPSRYEGFGLQLVEAMAMGCPVLASNRASLPEILGKGGEVFSIGTPSVLVELLKKVAADQNFRMELRRRATQRYRDFSWEMTAEKTLQVYRKLVS
jgi:glycosyltransferase involved in cell wall biosynthesis